MFFTTKDTTDTKEQNLAFTFVSLVSLVVRVTICASL